MISSNPNTSQEQLIDLTILEFHTRRRQLADCLRYIFEAAEVAQNAEAPQLYEQLEVFVRHQILSENPQFPRKLFAEMDKLGDTILKVQNARQNAKSSTTAPSQQGS